MEKDSASRSRRSPSLLWIIGVANALVISAAGIALLAYWTQLAAPLLETDQQTKSELIVASYARLITETLERDGSVGVAAVLDELRRLTDPSTKEPLVARVELALEGGETVARGEDPSGGVLSSRVVEAPLFSTSTFELLGTLRVYRKLDGRVHTTAFMMVMGLILGLLLAFQIVLSKMLRPLRDLARRFDEIDPANVRSIEDLDGFVPSEISGVHGAAQTLLLRLEEQRFRTGLKRREVGARSVELADANSAMQRMAETLATELEDRSRELSGLASIISEASASGDAERMQTSSGILDRIAGRLEEVSAVLRKRSRGAQLGDDGPEGSGRPDRSRRPGGAEGSGGAGESGGFGGSGGS